MRCPYCQSDNDRVIDSRVTPDAGTIRRRRHCQGCDRRFTTMERVEPVTVKVVKKNGAREPFDREKIKRGLATACWKRPIRDEQIEKTVQAIEAHIYEKFDEIESRYLGELLMERLRELDQVAYVRFASVYREFEDALDFVQELEPILGQSQRRAT
jgi:transcriptional repressor NrdR